MATKQTTKASKAKSSDKPNANKGTKASTKEAKPTARGEAIAASWGNKKTAAARSLKQKVKVDGVEYNSVAAAFEALKLPLGQHIKFRMELKASAGGRKTFETDKGKKHVFSLVK